MANAGTPIVFVFIVVLVILFICYSRSNSEGVVMPSGRAAGGGGGHRGGGGGGGRRRHHGGGRRHRRGGRGWGGGGWGRFPYYSWPWQTMYYSDGGYPGYCDENCRYYFTQCLSGPSPRGECRRQYAACLEYGGCDYPL